MSPFIRPSPKGFIEPMDNNEPAEAPSTTDRIHPTQPAVSEAVLTEAVRHADIVITSLTGMTAIVAVLLVAIALPTFGLAPVTQPLAVITMIVVSIIGIGVLYVLNYRVHQHVTNQARLTEVLVNSLGQGFLVFGRGGLCGPVYSQACLDLLETVPAGKHVATVLRVPGEQQNDFQEWLEILFQPDHALGFDDVTKFLPSYFPHGQRRRINLVYRPVYNKAGALMNVVVIATDQTEEYEARQNAKKQQSYAEMICRIFKERNKYHTTLAHLREFLEAASTPTLGLRDGAPLLRQLHTIKATVKHFNLLDLADVIHEVENDLRSPLVTDDASFFRALQSGRQKVGEALLRLTDEVGGLMGGEHEWRGNVREIEERELYAFAGEMTKHGADPALIQHYLSTIAAVPIRDCFHSFERELQELATMLDKQIKPVKFTGSNPRVLTQPIQEFLFSLTHICRNIVDHGIEAPVTRMARSKDAAGQVIIHADIVRRGSVPGDWLHLVISDDGNGIDPSRIRAKLSAIDPEGSWRFEDDQTVIQRIFSWGFSTNDDVTSLSGRGVGLEAVEREVKLLGGAIHVSSELYKGVSFDIFIPYSLDIKQIVAPLEDKVPAAS
jgi:two-component system, chemotaxis family, sensor kinase CheA